MFATLLSAVITCAASLALGQAVLWICGQRAWSWLAAPVGISAAMLLAVPSLHMPGRTVTTGIIILLATALAVALLVRDSRARPGLVGLLAGLAPFLLTLVPLLVAGRSGPLGVSISNDMSAHLLIADAHSQAALTPNVGPNYPLGPHALVASIADTLGLATDHAFTGFTMALPVLLGWTALGFVRDGGRIGAPVVTALVGMPFLIAAFFGQGAFKEILLAALVMGWALLLSGHRAPSGLLRWVPAAVLVAGMISVYSYSGLLWPVAFFVLWLAILAVTALRSAAGREKAASALRAEAAPFGLAVLVGLVALVPQMPRIYRYLQQTGGGTGLEAGALGNLVGPLPFWEALGIWDVADFRFPAEDPLATGVWAGLVLALALAGAVWWVRRGSWMVPVAAAACALIWIYADRQQSPYVAAKALVLLSPFVLLLAVRPFVERDGWQRLVSGRWRLAVPLVLAALAFKVVESSWDALRHSMVGPRAHAQQLQSLRPLLQNRPTLFLGNDDFIRWELQGVPVLAPFIGAPGVPTRPEKNWQYGQAIDVDTVAPEVLSQVSWVIAPRDAAGSAMPRELRLVRTTRDFALYRRDGVVPDRRILPEGEAPGAVLDCTKNPDARRLSKTPGRAGIRGGGVAVPVEPIGPGDERVVTLQLPPGEWDVVLGYTSALPVEVSAPGMRRTTLPANLDRPGPRYPVGRMRVERPGGVPVRFRVPGRLLGSTAAPAVPSALIAVPAGSDRTVPMRRACGELVDYYLPQAG